MTTALAKTERMLEPYASILRGYDFVIGANKEETARVARHIIMSARQMSCFNSQYTMAKMLLLTRPEAIKKLESSLSGRSLEAWAFLTIAQYEAWCEFHKEDEHEITN